LVFQINGFGLWVLLQGPRRVVPLGDKLVDYAPAFRLMLLTRNPSPDLSPDARALVSEVLFFVLWQPFCN
jgi:hypothetical protein